MKPLIPDRSPKIPAVYEFCQTVQSYNAFLHDSSTTYSPNTHMSNSSFIMTQAVICTHRIRLSKGPLINQRTGVVDVHRAAVNTTRQLGCPRNLLLGGHVSRRRHPRTLASSTSATCAAFISGLLYIQRTHSNTLLYTPIPSQAASSLRDSIWLRNLKESLRSSKGCFADCRPPRTTTMML